MRCFVQRDELGGCYDRDYAWVASEHGLDLDVALGHGRTPLRAIADLLWDLGREDIAPADIEIAWED